MTVEAFGRRDDMLQAVSPVFVNYSGLQRERKRKLYMSEKSTCLGNPHVPDIETEIWRSRVQGVGDTMAGFIGCLSSLISISTFCGKSENGPQIQIVENG